ncbi:uncharacterized protein LOC132201285 [Neocloeon triangulifer]|uniref:uncharacterized protein LOC132201285 n=1 Tax=Neocloeon triangulifer TaxID=2078957 RepID=UPI00286ED336|nr:uncharacterized protein LOC132201285 [Neocloeon triangulifer]
MLASIPIELLSESVSRAVALFISSAETIICSPSRRNFTRAAFMSGSNFGPRKFYSLPENYKGGESQPKKCHDTNKLIQYIDQNVVGKDTTFNGPYGGRKVVYCDYTASGRSLSFIEQFILSEVLPCYGNTHTTTSTTSLQSTLFRHEARDIFRNAVNASEHDAVIFAGNGCTGAVHKLIHALNLQVPPIVFVGPCEHHSNLLPWREIGAKIIRIPETKDGFLDLDNLKCQLEAHSQLNQQMIGCFSAASNITGVMADDVATTLLLHQFGALAFWDYATAAPYVKIDMNPLLHGAGESSVNKDAIFFSVHKFVGGVQTPGVLIAKKSLFKNKTPNGCGGGTVFFVSRDDHKYLKDVELREEGGTAAIVESVRAGLAMQLKESVGVQAIMAREEQIVKNVLAHIKTVPELLLLGPLTHSCNQRLAIFSFMVRHPRGTFLHHNFICTILNDVFGIQARGGCACAGPYAQDLLGINEDLAKKYEDILIEDSRLDRTHLRRQEEHSNYEMLRPGFARISLPYFMSDNEVAFVLEALKMVALEGWKLLPQYILNPETGEWRHRSNLVFKDRRWLGSINYVGGQMNYSDKKVANNALAVPEDYSHILQTARNIFGKARKMAQQYAIADQSILFDEHAEKLRWFMLPCEAQDLLLGHSQNVKHLVPFDPVNYEGSRSSPIPPPRIIEPQDSVESNSSVNFEVGGSVDPSNLTLQHTLCIEQSFNNCTSLDSSTVSPLPNLLLNQRSCCSQTDLLNMGAKENFVQSTEDIKAYVQGVTNEITQEIKSEIREVICQVQDVLHESESNECLPEMRPRSGSLSLKSAEDVAEYLVEASQKLASEMKSELREVVSAVDLLIAEETGELKRSSSQSLNSLNHFNFPEQSLMRSFRKPRTFSSPAPRSPLCNSPVIDDCLDGPTVIESESTSKEQESNGLESNVKVGQDLNQAVNSCSINRKISVASTRWFCPPKQIWKPTVEAIREFGMIRPGDRVLVCLSGGKDSLSLLHTIHQYQFYARSKNMDFEFGAITVDPQTSSYDPRPLIPYLQSLGVPYFYEEQSILDKATELKNMDACKSICSFCSRMKRGRIYAAARREGYNVLALGQHLDDLSESFMMSVFHNGRLRTMKAHYNVKERDLRVIRPFVFVREKNLRQFAESKKLPVIKENCPACFEAPKERHRTKQLLAQQEILFPKLMWSLRSAMMPLMSVHNTGVESKLFSSHLKKNSVSSDESEDSQAADTS